LSPVGAHVHKTTYAPLIDMALYVMVLMRAYQLLGHVGGGWAPGNQKCLGPVKWHCAIWQMPFQAQEIPDFRGPTPSHLPQLWISLHQNHYEQSPINQRCIGGFMYMSTY
jgi:hypothetical protein